MTQKTTILGNELMILFRDTIPSIVYRPLMKPFSAFVNKLYFFNNRFKKLKIKSNVKSKG